MSLQDINQLYKHKSSSVCVLLGSGKSINKISEAKWKILQNFDLWAINNWIYHPFIVPDFYHVETKHYGYDILQRRFQEKQEAYKNTKFIFPKGKWIKSATGNPRKLSAVVSEDFNRFEYQIKARDSKRTHNPFTADYKMNPCFYTKSYDMSITALFEMLFLFKYEKIILFGIDLIDSYYFWTGGNPKYGEVHHQTNKAHEGKDPNRPHNTYKIKDFIIDFNERWMKPVGREILTGHKKTSLYPDLKFDSLKDF